LAIENCWYGPLARSLPNRFSLRHDAELLIWRCFRGMHATLAGPHTPHLQNVIIPALPGFLISGKRLSCQT
jgi:hypothetical protein